MSQLWYIHFDGPIHFEFIVPLREEHIKVCQCRCGLLLEKATSGYLDLVASRDCFPNLVEHTLWRFEAIQSSTDKEMTSMASR